LIKIGSGFGSVEEFLKHIVWFLTFRGTCIVIYSYNKSQRDALFLRFIW